MEPTTTNTNPLTMTPDLLCLQVILGLQQLFTQALEKAQKEITKDNTNMVLHLSRQLGQWFDRQMKLQKSSPRTHSPSSSTSQISNLQPPSPSPALSSLSHLSNPSHLSHPSSSPISNLKSSNPDTEKIKEALKKQGHPKEEEKKPLWKELVEKPKNEKDPLHELMNGPGGVMAWADRQAKLSS